ncbi:MAG TPA: protein kinase [Gemmatimonadaceae bacterium]|jgi:predicted Ser/Thr protein kinase|nr:protein kinase [Gemmatimonadaceae bacterium]
MADLLDLDFIALQSALAGQYSLERELGRGGMGVVYLAREVQLDRHVALKVLPPALAQRADLRERFMREARTAAKLSHPNIVPIFRVDEVQGFVFFAMAYVEGETLSHRVRTRGPLPVAVATRMIQEVAWALAYAHARGVVHRDIKPDNILLEQGSGRAMVTDFGIAQVAEASQLTEVGQVMGTAHFMSPEQAAGEPIDGRSDLYSLGVVAHFALSGKLPFDGPTVQSILAKHLTQPPPSLSAMSAAIPRALAQAVDRTLAKEPAHRYANGEALAEALATAQGQRREIPAALRLWLQRGRSLRVVILVWEFFCSLEILLDFSPNDIVAFVAPLVIYVLYELYHTRRLFAAGYDLGDVRAALHEHIENRREELAFEYSEQPRLIERVIRYTTYLALGASVATGTGVLLALDWAPWTTTAITFGISTAVATFGAIIGFVTRRKERDLLDEARARSWDSGWGERLARIAGWRLRRRAPATTLHRPTEVAIGMAAVDLFRALPRATQKQLGDLPDLLEKLERDARDVRRRSEELSAQLDALSGTQAAASATLGDQGAIAERRAAVASELRVARDAASRRLAGTVAALENIRLDLLRLQAGAGSLESLTSAIDAARRVGSAVDDALSSREETERLLVRDSSPPEGQPAASGSR